MSGTGARVPTSAERGLAVGVQEDDHAQRAVGDGEEEIGGRDDHEWEEEEREKRPAAEAA